MNHKLKILEPFADAILSGDKTFEIRENDRGFQKGDTVTFDVLDELRTVVPWHRLSKMTFEITYVMSDWGVKEGWVAFGIRNVTDEMEPS